MSRELSRAGCSIGAAPWASCERFELCMLQMQADNNTVCGAILNRRGVGGRGEGAGHAWLFWLRTTTAIA